MVLGGEICGDKGGVSKGGQNAKLNFEKGSSSHIIIYLIASPLQFPSITAVS
jgi:hypothetical protein